MSFERGDRVRILRQNIVGHHRVPGYVMGHRGTITEPLKSEVIPEKAAQGKNSSPRIPVYLVKLNQSELWPDYTGSAHDTLEIEIYQHWLAPITAGPAHKA